MDAPKGLARAAELYKQKDKRAKEWKAQGKKVLGYLCLFAPPEIMTAAGVLPYRLRGDLKEPVTKAYEFVEPFGCPYVRNLFDQDLKGKFDFLDGLIMSHSCDMVQRIYGIWTLNKKPAFQYFVNVPHTLAPWSQEFFKREMVFFREKLGDFTGNQISDGQLKKTIAEYNQCRALLRKLYSFRKEDPPLVSGTETLQVLVAGMGLPAGEFKGLLQEVIEEVSSRKERLAPKGARLMIYGSVCDDLSLIQLAEENNAYVVIDDTCIGTRSFMQDVPETADPLDGLVTAYFTSFLCPRTDRGAEAGRLQYIADLAKEYRANGVVMYIYSYCDPHKFDVPDVREFLKKEGLPSLIIDDDYTLTNLAAIRTRIQAFLELLG
ncbi:MAG: 2-hydroxyacyl-CoA dehydratase family protein [Deltaproteobacteria bacterium]|nr:2-hydroxyacyl-CoA dehydratase family protein [Deltaproteobacteria bacterium]